MARFGGPAFDTSMFTDSHNEPGQQAMLAVHGHHGSLDLGDIAFGNGEKKETIKEDFNWSGYAVQSPQGPFTDVKGSWIVPSVSQTNQTAYSVTWIGIDGYPIGNNTVEQIGTEQDWINGQGAAYSAWYEMYPRNPVYLPSKYPVSAGDTMSAEVKYLGGKTYQMTLQDDRTTGPDWTYTKTLNASKPTMQSSAEWIVEGTPQLPLADFSKDEVTFTGAYATAAVGPGGTEHTGTISDPAWQTVPIKIVRGGVDEAVPTNPLLGDGSSFDINYVANSSSTGGAVTVSDGVLAANVASFGDYIASSFPAAGFGTPVHDTAALEPPTQMLTPHHA